MATLPATYSTQFALRRCGNRLLGRKGVSVMGVGAPMRGVLISEIFVLEFNRRCECFAFDGL